MSIIRIAWFVVVLLCATASATQLVAQTRTIAPGQTISASLDAQAPLDEFGTPYHEYSYSGNPGDLIAITVRSSAFDAVIEWGGYLEGEFWPLWEDDDSGGGTDSRITVMYFGDTDFIRVVSLFGDLGNYTITVDRVVAPSVRQSIPGNRSLPASGTVTGRITSQDPIGSSSLRYHDYLYAGGSDLIEVTAESGDPVAGIKMLWGVMVGGELYIADVLTTGAYQVGSGPEPWVLRVGTYESGVTNGGGVDYTINTRLIEGTGTPATPPIASPQDPAGFRSIAANQPVNAALAGTDPALSDGSHYHHYLYQGQPGEQVTVTMTSSAFDTYLAAGQVVNGELVTAQFDDDGAGGTNSRMVATIGASGTLGIRANSYAGGAIGAYTLTVATTGAAAPATGGAGQSQFRPIGANQTLTATLVQTDPALSDNSHYHLYRYRGQPGEQITVTMRSSEFDTYLYGGRLENGNFIFETSNDDGGGGTDSQITAVTDATGSYAIRANTLYGGVTGTYTLTVQTAAQLPSGVRPIAMGQTVSGLFSSSDARLGDNSHYHDYLYRGQPGEQIVITLRSAAFDAYLMGGRFDGSQFVYEEGNDDGAGGTDSQLTVTVGPNGTYGIRANTLFGGSTGAYTLAVQSAVVPVAAGGGPPMLRVGQTLSGRLQPGDPRLGDDSFYNPYLFEGTAGDRVLITMTSAEFDTYLRFGHDRNGQFEVITYDDDGAGGTNSRIVVTLPETGRYQIQANSYSAGLTGTYTLSIEDAGAAGPANVATVALNQTLQSRLEPSDPTLSDNSHYKLFVYSGQPGEQVLVTMRSSDFDAYLTTGRAVAGRFEAEQSNDDGGGGTDAQILTTLGSDGTLVIRANSFFGGQTGAFSLAVQAASAATAPAPAPAGAATIAAGQSIQGRLTAASWMLSDSSYFDQYVYTGSPGDRLRITLVSNDFDAYLMWGRLDGDRFQGTAYDDDGAGGTNARLEVTVDGTGVYALRANAYYPGETGAYTLTLERLDAAAPGPTPPVATPGPTPAPAPPGVETGGKFVFHYFDSSNAQYTALGQRIKQRRIFEQITGQLNERFHLPRNIDVSLDECGMVNAFYIPADTEIVFCYELLDLLAAIFVPDGQWTPEQQEQVDGAFRFILMHEIGHALVHVLDLPITGREEDVVDQLAVFQLVRGGDEKGAQAAVNGVSAIQPATTEFNEHDFAGEHSLGPVRLFNVLCWIYGSDPQKFTPIVSNGWLPEDRAVRCPSEWDRMSKAWQTILAQYTIQ